MPVLFVGNLPDDVKSREVEDVFYKFGRIESVNVRSKGKDTFAFVEFSRESDAEEAQRRRDGYQFDGRHRMRVEFSRGKKRDDRDDRRDNRRDDYDRKDDYHYRDDRRRDDYDRRDSGRGYNSYDKNWNDRGSNNRGWDKPRRERPTPRLNEKYYKVVVENMPENISWQDLKDFCKANGGSDVKFTEVRDGRGVAGFESKEQAERAIEAMNNTTMKNKQDVESIVSMHLVEPVMQEEAQQADQRMDSHEGSQDGGRDRSRSRGSPRYDE